MHKIPTELLDAQGALTPEAVIGVVGAGAMGAGITQVAAAYGHQVLLYDAAEGAAQQGIDKTAQGLSKLVAKGKLSQADADQLCGRIQAVNTLADFAPVDLVIEAIVENLEIKQKVFAELESLCRPHTLLTSNTSSISITSIAAPLAQPQRFAGLHFFNPAPIMKLVEVISGLATAPEVAQCLYATAKAWGKQSVYASSTPGFIVNRVARPFYAESLRLLEEGAASVATLDALMRDAGGFRMGPFELMDLIGHDVNYAVTSSVFSAYYQDPRFKPSLIQKALVEGGRLGRKSGQGFYAYTETAGALVHAQAKQAVNYATAAPAPSEILLEGNLGPAQALITRSQAAGIPMHQRANAGRTQDGLLRIGDACVALTDGRMASERAVVEGISQLVVLDLALDYAKTTHLAIAAADSTSETAVTQVVGWLQALGIQVSVMEDTPALVVMRTLAMLANEAADAVLQGVCNPQDADIAMQNGVNYPRGPLAWAQEVGLARIYQVLAHLQASYAEDRYRPALLLRRKAYSGGVFYE
ncbi:3-hydroxybutyryl-CoA dehydrogenase [Allopseudospirillum japonicum]|uniref:3-hydroxybutyryl-CoA dehydrogenase n=1 Tax=Allopseudospirillum japonicum TaxID=64971 RepID=A0A1H6T407_9GAMM|nr:3-hydroxyacyl-CoA dehydrogenase PaaH [Allopseudospirillum japonicum]SEI70542.1 3-hydroxybutyryl-CoA dehydrogenase [Allopseudospirillum japonicum]